MSDRFPHASESVSAVLLLLLLLGFTGCGGGSSHSNFVTPPAGPPAISSLSTSAGVFGASVQISGSNFGAQEGASTVTFNGTAASIAKWSDSAIVAKVPSGATSGNVVVTVGSSASNGVNFNVVALPTGSIALSNFGFQCGPGDTADCEGSGKGIITWPQTLAQPGMVRLHDAGTQWANMDKGGGQYDFTELDQWLDLIAANQVEAAQVFTWVPCWAAPAPCTAPPTAPAGTSTPPGDLGPGGSPSFNAFVTAFVQHCNSNNHCVKDLIRYYEMWNEWDLAFHWTGTMQQVFQMVAPASTIIRTNVPNAVILMPSSTPDSPTGGPTDLQNWLSLEDANLINGKHMSDWVNWHVYLTKAANSATQTATPEDQWSNYNANFLSVQASNSNWKNARWVNSETNFNGAPPPGLNYQCPSAQFTADDCTGQIVRWQLLHDSNGAAGVYWYKWNETIGANQQYQTAYYYMMQVDYLAGGTFGGPCQPLNNGSTTWTCPFTKADGKPALWVWTTDESSGITFQVPSGAGYVDYRDLTGGTTSLGGQTVPIGVMPIMLEQ
jgi:hypothetical protein